MASATTALSPQSGPPARRTALALLLLGVLAGLLAPVWTVRYEPLVDYPNHLASAFVLAHLHDPAFQFSNFYSAAWHANPYLLMDWILLALQWVFPIGAAGRILLSLTVLAVPAAAWFFLRRANPGEDHLAWWSLLIPMNLYFFLYAFINTQLSLALCLFLIGVWLGYLEKPRVALYLALLALTTLLYFTHLLGFGVAGFVMTVYVLLSRRGWRQLLLTWLLFLPGALLFLSPHGAGGTPSSWSIVYRGFEGKLAGLLVIVSAVSPAVDFLTAIALIVCVVAARTDNRQFRWNRAWTGVAILFFLLYCAFPAGYGSGLSADRQLLPFWFLLALAAVKVGPRARRLAIIALVLFALRAVALEHNFLSLQPRLEQIARSFDVIPPGARVVPLIGWEEEARPSPYRTLWAYGVIARGWLTPTLFHNAGVQPLELNPNVDYPYRPGAYGSQGVTNWARVQREYDYVWAYRSPLDAGPPPAIGSPVFQAEGLVVYRLLHSPGAAK